MNLMEIYRSINDFSSGPHRILCPLQVHTTQQIKKKNSGQASTGCDKKKTALQVHAQSLPIPTAAKKSIAPSRSKDTLTNQFQYIFFSLFFFFFFVDLWSSFFYFKNFILCLMNVLISCCTFRGEVCFVYCLLAQHSLFINFSCLTSSFTVNDQRAKNYLWSFTPPS